MSSDMPTAPAAGQMRRLLPFLILVACTGVVPFVTGIAIVSLTTKILIYGLFAMSLDLLVGYAGLWALGHAAFFAIGAYATGILTTEFGIASFLLSAPLTLLAVAAAACFFGVIVLRTSGIYFLLITLAVGQVVFGMANTSAGTLGRLTGGSDGLVGIPYPGLWMELNSVGFYYFTLIVVLVCVVLMWRLVDSPFGYALRGIREDEVRLNALGYNIWLFKLIAFVISGVFAGIAGMLFAHFNGYISPDAASVETTGLLWLMIIIGGSGTLWGGMLGSFIVLSLHYFVSAATPERWQLILGVTFVAAVMIFRHGLFPWFERVWKRVIGDVRPWG